MKRFLLTAAALSALLAGCNNEETTTSSASEATKLTMAHNSSFTTLDPISAWAGWQLTRFGIGEGLVKFDANMQLQPMIAKEWKAVDDRTTTFTLREGVTFHNDKPVDAAAVKASIERAIAETDRADIVIPIERIDADGLTLTITTTKPFPLLLNNLADPVYTIIDVTEDNIEETPVATGPFEVETMATEQLTLAQHDDYWNGASTIEEITVKSIPDDSTRTMALQSGEVDFIAHVSPGDAALFENNDAYTVLKGPNLRVIQLGLNMDKPYMQSLPFRQALAHALQKDVYAQQLADAIPAKGPFTSELNFGRTEDDVYRYDVAKANALLDTAGFVDTDNNGIREHNGEDIVLDYLLTTAHGTVAKNVAVAIQDDYKKIGIGVNISQLENVSDLLAQGDYDILWEGWTSAPTADPAYFLQANYSDQAILRKGSYTSEAMDAFIAQLDTTFDQQQRYEIGQQAVQLLLEEVPTIFLYYQQGIIVTKSEVTGIERYMSEIYYIDEKVTKQ